ncbi:monocarboxylate transporter 13-like [Acanthaster planci]|uniref:Monocarboxylate transporter 13-like n=1 Tax=Acanthaster planci TaxID=133434 RepID=A0A8B7YD82_ACAPL|nr:monocarboxylate transporter 13-like [Acanthaster planci]XP_022091222.1 monocarboxylate transporter 13-like [Acanthaster planci]
MASTGAKPVIKDHDKWGWVMVAAAFVNCFVIYGQLKALGVLLIPISNDYNCDLGLIGWIAVLYGMVQNCIAPVVAALARFLGSSRMMMFGGLLNAVGIILTAVSPSVPLFSIFVIGMAGVGSAFCWYIGFAVMASYFKEKYPLAIGISTMGEPIGMMFYAPVTQVLFNTYGWRGCLLLLGALSAHMVASGLLVRHDPSRPTLPDSDEEYQYVAARDEEEISEEEGAVGGEQAEPSQQRNGSDPDLSQRSCFKRFVKAIDFRVMADVRFVLLICGRSTATFAFSAWLVFMVAQGQFQGLNQVQASFLPTAFGVGNIVGKLPMPLAPKIGIKPSMTSWACFGAALVCISFLGVAAVQQAFVGQILLTGLSGFGYAILYQAEDVMVRFLSSDGRLVSMLSWQGMLTSIAGALGGLISGWVLERTGSFLISLGMFGGAVFLSIPLFIGEAIYTERRAH